MEGRYKQYKWPRRLCIWLWLDDNLCFNIFNNTCVVQLMIDGYIAPSPYNKLYIIIDPLFLLLETNAWMHTKQYCRIKANLPDNFRFVFDTRINSRLKDYWTSFGSCNLFVCFFSCFLVFSPREEKGQESWYVCFSKNLLGFYKNLLFFFLEKLIFSKSVQIFYWVHSIFVKTKIHFLNFFLNFFLLNNNDNNN